MTPITTHLPPKIRDEPHKPIDQKQQTFRWPQWYTSDLKNYPTNTKGRYLSQPCTGWLPMPAVDFFYDPPRSATFPPCLDTWNEPTSAQPSTIWVVSLIVNEHLLPRAPPTWPQHQVFTGKGSGWSNSMGGVARRAHSTQEGPLFHSLNHVQFPRWYAIMFRGVCMLRRGTR